MAGDGNPASPAYQKFGRDVYGFSLGYHNNDYKPIGGSAANAFSNIFTSPTGAVGTTGNTGAQLFNGNISNTTVALNKINTGQTTGYSYLYDQLNRLLGMRQHSISGTIWNYGTFNPAYEEKFSYDANGNIKTLMRKGANITGMPLPMDSLKYFYYYTNTSNARAAYDPTIALPGNVKSLSNQLAHVTDSDPAGNYPDDIDNQTAGNYDYDNIGNLIKDVKDSITGVNWTVYGKIKQITKSSGVVINYGYDVSGNRVSKEVTNAPGGGTTKQFYIRDAQGNTMAIYNGKTSYVEWAEQHLYGSSRLGIWNYGKQVPLLPVGVSYDSMMVGSYNYELTNHLGNVLSTISDKKVGISAGKVTVDYYNAEILNQNDYYAFGSLMPGRKYSVANTNYRYGFNGKENDNEIKGEGNQQDYGMRIYDSRLGRFLSTDPIASKYPELTPYQFASNSPISGIDQDGLEYENAQARYKVARYGVDALQIKRVDEGWGKVQSQLYSLKTHGTSQEFTKLRETFLNNPQKVTNNFYATYAPIKKTNPNILTSGDAIGIDIKVGVIPVAFKIYVRVMDVQQTDNSFKMTFATLEGHTDAGYITFSGSFNEKTGELDFTIFNETRENHGMGYATFAGRPAQQDQWEDVIGNVREFLGKDKKEVTMQENIKKYDYDETKPMGKGKLVKEKTAKIDE